MADRHLDLVCTCNGRGRDTEVQWRPVSTYSISSDDESLPDQTTQSNAFSGRGLACSFVAMVAIGHCQYTWTLFVLPIQESLTTSTAAVQGAFSTFVTLQTFAVLGLGVLVSTDLHHRAMALGAVCLLGALVGVGSARSLPMLYACMALMGMGVGFVYNYCMTISLRCSLQHRGLAAGLTAAGYGSGSLLTISLIERAIVRDGYRHVSVVLGWGISLTVLLCALAMPSSLKGTAQADDDDARSRGRIVHGWQRELRLVEAAREASFWLLYLMLVIISTIGLVVTTQLAPIARTFHVPQATLVTALQVRECD